MNSEYRLYVDVSAVCPVYGIEKDGTTGEVKILYKPEATQGQRDAADAVVRNFDWSQGANERAYAKAVMDDLKYDSRADRCIVKLSVDEINRICERIRAMDQAVAQATTLANLKTLWAGLPNLPNRTYQQARAAYNNLIDQE